MDQGGADYGIRVAKGVFSGAKLAGQGVAASLLAQHGIRLYSEEELTPELLQKLLEKET